MAFLECLLVSAFFFCHLYRNPREYPHLVLRLLLVQLPDDKLSASYLTCFTLVSVYVH